MIHPDTTLRWVSDAVGFGVFATADIPRGTITWVLDPLDQRISPTRAGVLGPKWAGVLRRFGYFDAQGNVVISWDHARFVNHGCEPNTASGGDDRFEIALRDIRAGEQLTDDYTELDLGDEWFPCRCGAAACKGEVRGRSGPIEPARLALLQAALDLAPRLHQPLEAHALTQTPWLQVPAA